MIRLVAAASALVGVGAQSSAPPSELPQIATVFAQTTVRQQVIIRVPRPRIPAMSASTRWRETSGPRCITAEKIRGALPGASSVDIVLNDKRRVRAHFGQRCAGLNYYRGVYVNANPDGRICAGRDVVRSRMGGQCEIVEFRVLQPVRP